MVLLELKNFTSWKYPRKMLTLDLINDNIRTKITSMKNLTRSALVIIDQLCITIYNQTVLKHGY